MEENQGALAPEESQGTQLPEDPFAQATEDALEELKEFSADDPDSGESTDDTGLLEEGYEEETPEEGEEGPQEAVQLKLPSGEVIEVPAEAGETFQKLIESAGTQSEIREREYQLQEKEQKYDEAMLSIFTDPFSAFSAAFQGAPEAAERTAQLWFISDEGRLERLMNFIDEIATDDRARDIATRERTLELNQRYQNAQRYHASVKQRETQQARQKRVVDDLLGKVDAKVAEFVRPRVAMEIKQLVQNNGQAALTTDAIRNIVQPWLDHFGKSPDPSLVENENRRIKDRLSKAYKARVVVDPKRSGRPQPSFKPPKGMDLDQLNKAIRSGKMRLPIR